HPIKQFFDRYLVQAIDGRYEIPLHAIYVGIMKDRLRALERKVHCLQHQRGDYKACPTNDKMAELETRHTEVISRGLSSERGTMSLSGLVVPDKPDYSNRKYKKEHL
ncbi:unnamed protein product, partial [Didymodactylos carnosus]